MGLKQTTHVKRAYLAQAETGNTNSKFMPGK